MLSEHNKYEVRKIISEVFEIPVVAVMDGDIIDYDYSAEEHELMYIEHYFEAFFKIDMGDWSRVKTVSDLYEHLDELID